MATELEKLAAKINALPQADRLILAAGLLKEGGRKRLVQSIVERVSLELSAELLRERG